MPPPPGEPLEPSPAAEPVPTGYPPYPPYPTYPTYSAPPAGYGYPQPSRTHEPPPSKTMAGWALGLALVPCLGGISTLVGLGLGITVLVRGRDGRDHGRGLAIGAVIAATSWIVVGVIVLVGAVVEGIDSEPDDLLADPNSDAAVEKLRVGDCFNSPELSDAVPDTSVEASAVESMPCDAPHEFEAFHSFVIAGEDYPGEDEVITRADDGCRAAFPDFVGIPFRRSELAFAFRYPTPRSWRIGDDRTVTCLIGDPTTNVTGTLADARR